MWKQTTRKRVLPRRRPVRLWLAGSLILILITVAGLIVWAGRALLGGTRSP